MVSLNTPSVYDFLMRMVNKQTKKQFNEAWADIKIRGEMSVNPSGKKQTKHGNFIKNHRGVGSALSLREKGG
jgi:hypothetical protein